MRVAYIASTMNTGGYERCIGHFCNHLDRTRYQPVVICLSRSGPAADWIEADDVPVIELGKKPGNDWRVIGRLAKELKDRQIQLVQSHNWGTLVETSIAARRAGCKHIHTEHGQQVLADSLGMIKLRLHRWARKWAFRRCDAVIACAESVRRRLAEIWRFPESSIEFLPNGIQLLQTRQRETPEVIRKRLGIPPTHIVLGAVGRLAAVKDLGVAVKALRQLVKGKHPDTHLILVGDGPEQSAIERQVDELELTGHVHLVGRRDNVTDWLRTIDIYVNCSKSEAMSMAILEAMAARRPVIATDVGDTHVLIGGNSPAGILVPPSTAHLLADAIAGLIVSPGRREEMGRNGFRRFESNYTVAQMVQNYERLYERILGRADSDRELITA